MGPTKLPNPKSLRPLVVPVQEKERESFHQHCLAKCADTSHLCLATERETAYSNFTHQVPKPSTPKVP